MSDLYKQRFSEVHAQMESLLASQKNVYNEFLSRSQIEIEGAALLEWKIKAKNLLNKACGVESEHYQAFSKNENPGGVR